MSCSLIYGKELCMPICKKCHKKWSWKETIKQTTTLNTELLCPYCGKKQYQSKKSKITGSFLSLIILLPFLIQTFVKISVLVKLSLLPILVTIVVLGYPFILRLSNEEESNFLKDN